MLSNWVEVSEGRGHAEAAAALAVISGEFSGISSKPLFAMIARQDLDITEFSEPFNAIPNSTEEKAEY